MRDNNQDEEAAIELAPALSLDTEKGDQIINELANLTEMVELQGVEQQRILTSIYNRLGQPSSHSAPDPEITEKGKSVKTGPKKPETDGPEKGNLGISGPEKGSSAPVVAVGRRPTLSESGPIREIEVKEVISDPEKEKLAPKKREGGKQSGAGIPPPSDPNIAIQARARRTITLGEEPIATPPQVSPARDSSREVVGTPASIVPPPSPAPVSPPPAPSKGTGFYLGDDGKVRRPDGKFANKVEARRFNRERNQDADEGAGTASPSLLARALGLLERKDGADFAGTETADSAGVAVGSSFWLAAKEVKGMADEVRDALAEISTPQDAKGYAQDKLAKAWGAIKKPFTRGEEAGAGEESAAQSVAGKGKEAPAAASGVEFRQEAQEAKSAAQQQQQQATAEVQHHEVLDRLDALIDASKPQSKGLVDMAADTLGERMGRDRKRKGRGASRGGRTNPLGSGTDLADGGRNRRQPGRTGRMPHIEGRGPVPVAAGEVAGRTGRLARVAAKMPIVGAPLASVASMGGMAGGALSAAPGAIATAGRGAMAMGSRAVPLIGAALTAYDAYTGFTDEEGQRRVFGLDQAKDPTMGQKAAMGASKVLDLGGLTSGLSGLLADGAGALGMKNLQQSLTFDSDSMAKGIHAAFSNDKALAAMGVEEGGSGTMGQNLAANVARAANLGGVVSGTASLLGGIAEDLGFDGAKEALTFDTGELAESLYDFFGPILGADKKGESDRMIINNSTARYEAAGARRGITEAEVTKAGKQYDFSALEQANSLPSGFMNAVSGVESNGNPLAYNKSGAAGMFQLMPSTSKAMGVTDPYDVQQSAAATAKLAVDNARYFNKTVGRPEEGRELYLLHQQGMGGGTALMKNPNLSAVEALSRGGQKNASQAVLQNGGNLNMSAQEFADMIMAKYDRQFMAQTIAKERGAKAMPMDKATEVAVKAAREAPSMVLKSSANKTPPSKVESVPTGKGWSNVLDIQQERARAELADPNGGELTAKMDPKMTEVMAKLDKTLNGMKPSTTESKGADSSTTNNSTTNNYYGKSRGVGDHDYVRWPNSDKG